MRTLANAFLVAFFADGLLSLLNALLARGVGLAVLPGPARLLALAVGLLALGVFVLVGLGPRLPKRLFLPLCLFVPWSVASGLPLPVYLGLADTAVVLGAVQVLLGAGALGWVRRRTGGRSWLLTADVLAGPGFRWGHAAGFFGAATLLGPLAAAGYGALCLALAASHLTGGFVALGPGGLSAQERVYARGDQRVHLAAMVHVADAQFYRDVLAGVPIEGSVVLLEGVSDEGRRLRSDFSYGRLASALGLDAQEDALTLPEGLAVELADVDVAEFAPSTIELLGAAARVLGSADAAEAVEAYRGLAEVASRPGAAEQIRTDLIDLRDRRLLERLGEALGRHERVVIPWGAAHMPGIEAGVLALDFRLEETRQRRVIRFGRGSTPEP